MKNSTDLVGAMSMNRHERRKIGKLSGIKIRGIQKPNENITIKKEDKLAQDIQTSPEEVVLEDTPKENI